MRKEDFEDIIFSDVVEFRKKDKEFKKGGETTKILVEFNRTPYDILIEKIKNKISDKKTDKMSDELYIRYKDTGESWDMGYINMNLNFWKHLEDVFYNYRPEFYKIVGDKLEPIEKGDLIIGEKFFGGELDEYIE